METITAVMFTERGLRFEELVDGVVLRCAP